MPRGGEGSEGGEGVVVPWAEASGNPGGGIQNGLGMGIGDGGVSVPYRRRNKLSKRARRKGMIEAAGIHKPTFVLAANVELGEKKRGRIHSPEFGIACHYCRQKTIQDHAQCSFCVLRWCGGCLRNRIGEELQAIMRMDRWMCPRCRGGCGPGCLTNCCNCGPCRKQQGLNPTGSVIHAARNAGFNNAHDYLVHLQTGESSEAIASRRSLWIKFPQRSEGVTDGVNEPEQAVPVRSPPPAAICPAEQPKRLEWVSSPPSMAASPPADDSGPVFALTEEPQQQHLEWKKTKSRSGRWILFNLGWGNSPKSIFYEKAELLRLRFVSRGAMWEVGRKFNLK